MKKPKKKVKKAVMKEYRVPVTISRDSMLVIEAESYEDAKDKAWSYDFVAENYVDSEEVTAVGEPEECE
jgi:uncharacterized protein YciI